MRRSRRVYQAPECPETPAVSDTEDAGRVKKNTNNDPTQPLTGSHPHRGPSTDDSQQTDRNGKLAEPSSRPDSDTRDESSILSRCLCCWRRRTDTNGAAVGEKCVFVFNVK